MSELNLKEYDNRILKDRRNQPTPCLSRYIISGRRKMFRRKTDQWKGGYLDRYGTRSFLLLFLIAGLNVLDSVFSKMILNYGGWELNPIVRFANELYGDSIWIWKIIAVSGLLLFLFLHSKFMKVEIIMAGIASIYTTLVIYQFFLYLLIAT
jgi:hypothetical protein